MATLSRQDSSDGRADQPEEVRDLRAMRGDSLPCFSSPTCAPSRDVMPC